MNANMKRRFVFCLGAMLLAGTLAAQTPVPEWQAGGDKVKSLIKANPEQASDAAGELLKGKNKKNVELVTSVARAYLDAGQLKEAETYLEMARKADNKAPAVSVLEGDIAFARKDIGKACQLYEQAIYFDSNYKDAYLKYARAYKSASPSQAIEKLNQLKAIAPDCLEADKELAEVYYATNRFGKAADTYAKFINTPVATEDDILKYAFALFLNHDFEKSLEVAQKGLRKNARHAAFNRLVMYNNVDLKRYDEAEKAADAFFNASDNADYSCLDYRYHGALLSALKKYNRAIEEYGKALEKDKTRVDLWREIADAYELENYLLAKGVETDYEFLVLPNNTEDREPELTRLRTEIMAGEGPDAFILNATIPGTVTDSGDVPVSQRGKEHVLPPVLRPGGHGAAKRNRGPGKLQPDGDGRGCYRGRPVPAAPDLYLLYGGG